MSEFVNRLTSALADRRWDDYDEAWLDAVEAEGATIPEYLQAAEMARKADQGERVGLLLALLAPQAAHLATRDRMHFFEELVLCSPGEREHRDPLLEVYQELYGNIDNFDVYLKTADLKRTNDPAKAIALLHRMVDFSPGAFVYHRSGWGVGEIKELIPIESMAVIDFQEKPSHRVRVDAIPEICNLLDAEHLRVLAWRQPEMLRTMSQEDPVELVRKVLASNPRPQPLAKIREALAGSVIPTNDWSKWWAKVRNQVKKDPGIGLSGDKKVEYFLLTGPEGRSAEIERRMRGADFAGALRLARELLGELSSDELPLLEPVIARLRLQLLRGDGTHAQQLEAMLLLRRLDPHDTELPSIDDFLARDPHASATINNLSRIDDQQEVIDHLKLNHDDWNELFIELLLRVDDPPRNYLLSLMEMEGRLDELDHWAREVNRVPKKAPMYYLWLTRLRARDEVDKVPSIGYMPPIDMYRKAVVLLDYLSLRAEHERSSELELLVKRYRHHLAAKPFRLLAQVTDGTSSQALRELYHIFESGRGFTPTTLQRLLAFLLRKDPDLLSSEIDRTSTLDESVIYATDEGIQRKRSELEEIRNDKLPAIFDAIGEAAAMGDLSENAEFSSAIEERENLNRRAIEIQGLLDRAVRIDPSEASTEYVTLGSRVSLTQLDNNEKQTYSVLGPWDGDPDQGVVSYLSPLGRGLLDKRVGDEFDVELPSGSARFRVDALAVHGGSSVETSS